MGVLFVKKKAINFLYAVDCYLLYILSGIIASVAVVAYYSVVAARDFGSFGADMDANSFFEYIANVLSGKASVVLLISYVLVLAATVVVFAVKRMRMVSYTGLSYCRPVSLIASVCLGVLLNLIVMHFVPEQSGGEAEFTLLFVLCIILGPIVEELMFRGILLKMFGASVGIVFSVIITSALFAVAHGGIVQIAYTFILGLVLGIVRYKSTSLWSSIAVHVAFNLSGAFATVFSFGFDSFEILLILIAAAVLFVLSCTGGRKWRKSA